MSNPALLDMIAGRIGRQSEHVRRRAAPPMPDADSLSREAAYELFKACKKTVGFAQTFWPVVEPGRRFVPGWHLDCVGEHLDVVSDPESSEMPDLIINVPPRTSKPVWEEELVLMADGSRKRLREVVVGDRVIGKSGRPAAVSAVHLQGTIPTVAVKTFGGREVVMAPDHPVLTPRGWVKAADLVPGEAVALASRYATEGASDRPPEEFRLAGYFVGDGCTASSGGSFFANVTACTPAYLADAVACGRTMGFTATVVTRAGTTRPITAVNFSRGVRPWLQSVGLARKTSYTKRVPEFVFTAAPHLVAEFIAAYFHCDGCVTLSGGGHSRVSFSSVSRELLSDVRHLLTRLGVNSRIRVRVLKTANGFAPAGYTSYTLDVASGEDVARFAARVPLSGPKAELLARTVKPAADFDQPYLPDVVVAVEPAGERPCRCLTVPGEDTFVAGDVVVHNSLMTCVFWFCKVWATQPATRWMFASFNQDLITRDSQRCRDIIKHRLYRRLWDTRISPQRDTQLLFHNTHQGVRQCVTTRGSGGMGEGADFLVIDDPQNPKLASSQVERENTIRWYRSTFSRRGNDEMTVRKVVIMQRLNDRDLTGYLIAEQMGWHHLVLPMRYEPRRYFLPDNFKPQTVAGSAAEAIATLERAAREAGLVLPPLPGVPAGGDVVAVSALAVGDAPGEAAPPSRPRDAIVPTPLQLRRPDLMDGPTGSRREHEGDLLWPARFPERAVAKAEMELGPEAPGQYAQRPTGESGDIFTKESFRYYDAVFDTEEGAEGTFTHTFARVRLRGPEEGQVREFPAGSLHFLQTIDTAMSENRRAAYTACLTFGVTPEHDIILWHAFRARVPVQYQFDMIAALRDGAAHWQPKAKLIIPGPKWPFRIIAQAVEPKASGIGLISQARAAGTPFHPLKVDGDKVKRAQPVAVMYKNGQVYHPTHRTSWLEDYQNEILVFPNGAFKDYADCVSYSGQLVIHDKIIRHMITGVTVAEIGEPLEETRDNVTKINVGGHEVEIEWPDDDDGLYGAFLGGR